jgi:hypothetical protein
MQKLCRITVPDLSVKRDFPAARRHLMALGGIALLALGRPALRKSATLDASTTSRRGGLASRQGRHNYYAISYYNV